MAKIAYKDIRFKRATRDMLTLIDAITEEYVDKGFTLTVRQLYYQLVARGHIENNTKNYKNIANIVNDGRMAGLIDWDAIEDRTRYTRSNTHWMSPQQILKAAADSYMKDRRLTQPVYLEAWIEKDALVGVLEQTANAQDVPCFSCRGYPSTSAVRDAATRFLQEGHRRARVILYAGDHDPSGLDIPRDISDRLRDFGADVTVKRIALTTEQVQQYNPPPNPAKETDTRAAGYIKQHGVYSWELDALDPQVLSDLYRREIEALTDSALDQQRVRAEDADRDKLIAVYRNWN